MTIEQNTPDWLAFRKGKITASKIPIIMGESPYMTAYGLWQEEMGFTSSQPEGQHMRKAREVEEAGRQFISQWCGLDFLATVVTEPNNEKYMASLDGLTLCGKIGCEIKYNNAENHEQAKKGIIPRFHMLQMQWQHFCGNLDTHYYISGGSKGDFVILECMRDNKLIELEVEAAEGFLRCLASQTPPPLSDKDYVHFEHGSKIDSLIKLYQDEEALAKAHKSCADSYKKMIIEEASGKNCCGQGWKLTRYVTKGTVDYASIPELVNVDLEKYRKLPSTAFRITLSE